MLEIFMEAIKLIASALDKRVLTGIFDGWKAGIVSVTDAYYYDILLKLLAI
ncbi:MAG: hypothetical protein Tsb0034_02250 [Ekhidna sp.]